MAEEMELDAMVVEVKLDLEDHTGKMTNMAGAAMDSPSRVSKQRAGEDFLAVLAQSLGAAPFLPFLHIPFHQHLLIYSPILMLEVCTEGV
jgi:hypothetical protein